MIFGAALVLAKIFSGTSCENHEYNASHGLAD